MRLKLSIALALIFTLAISAAAFAAYERTADNTVPAYTDPELRNRNGQERVDAGDRLIVFEERGNAYYVRYPVRNGTKDRWVPKNVFNNGNSNARWAYPAEADYYIVPFNSSCAIDVPNNWHNEGNILQIYGQNQMPAQIFTIKRVGNEWYKIIHKDSGHVMNVQGGNSGNGTRLWLYHYDGTASCHWRFRDLGNGVYNIESQLHSNPFLEVQNGNPFNGAILQLWQQHAGNAAKWTLKKVTTASSPNTVSINLNVPYFLQKDSRWAGVMIGTRNINDRGCLLTALAMKYSFHTNTNTTPDIMKNKLSFGGDNGNDLYWSSVDKLGYIYTKSYSTAINDSIMSIIYRELKNGKPVIIGGKGYEGQHWVVVIGYKGNSNTSFNSSDFIMNDPSHSDRKTLNQFLDGHNTVLRLIY